MFGVPTPSGLLFNNDSKRKFDKAIQIFFFILRCSAKQFGECENSIILQILLNLNRSFSDLMKS